jgi:hypothetical protein
MGGRPLSSLAATGSPKRRPDRSPPRVRCSGPLKGFHLLSGGARLSALSGDFFGGLARAGDAYFRGGVDAAESDGKASWEARGSVGCRSPGAGFWGTEGHAFEVVSDRIESAHIAHVVEFPAAGGKGKVVVPLADRYVTVVQTDLAIHQHHGRVIAGQSLGELVGIHRIPQDL